jgi:ABC-type nitrate/sulfonate/bicarbonate transport system substrate-binding protein
MPLYTVAAGILNGKLVAVTGDGLPHGSPPMADDPDQGALRIWDLAGGEQIGAVIPTGSRVEAVALGTLDGTPIVVALSLHDVRAWDLKSGTPIGRVIEMPEQYQINALELAELKGKTVAVVGGYDHELNM